MKRTLIVGMAVLAAAGCVPEEKYRAAKMEAENYRGQMSSAQTSATAAQQKADALQKQLDALNSNSGKRLGPGQQSAAATGRQAERLRRAEHPVRRADGQSRLDERAAGPAHQRIVEPGLVEPRPGRIRPGPRHREVQERPDLRRRPDHGEARCQNGAAEVRHDLEQPGGRVLRAADRRPHRQPSRSAIR